MSLTYVNKGNSNLARLDLRKISVDNFYNRSVREWLRENVIS